MKWYSKLTSEQLIKEKSRQEGYLKIFLKEKEQRKINHCTSFTIDGNIKECYRVLNRVNQILKERGI